MTEHDTKNIATRNIMLHYPKRLADKPIISTLIKKYDIIVNITRARIDQDEEGTLVIEISGLKKNIDAGLAYLDDLGITFKPVSKVIKRIDERCTHCSACIVVCPTKALAVRDRESMVVDFIEDRCIGCGLCIPACPYTAMEMSE
ncbi:MAG: 4Fe-4S binding protein [Spirochaetota bacterium]|nr:MAG: 4Fe-4S binding protein [Spirochaetota bacterium]